MKAADVALQHLEEFRITRYQYTGPVKSPECRTAVWVDLFTGGVIVVAQSGEEIWFNRLGEALTEAEWTL